MGRQLYFHSKSLLEHFVLMSESKSCSVVSDSLRPHGLYRIPYTWNSPGQNTGVGKKNANVDRAMLDLRSKRGGECVEKNILLRKLVQLRHADHPFVIGLIADQKPSPHNAHTWTTFFNQETAFLDGGEVLARKFDLGVVYAHITSPKRGHYLVHFEVITETPQEMPENEITMSYVRMIESNIRRQPERWLWTHNRWKWKRN